MHTEWIDTDYYTDLGVSQNASPAEIKKAYRRLARENHPDVSASPQAEETFKRASQAYEVLGDEKRRAEYDELKAMLAAGPQAGAPHYRFAGSAPYPPGNPPAGDYWQEGFDLSDLFGGAFPTGGASALRGGDITAEVTLPFRDAARGTQVTIGLGETFDCRIPAGVRDGATLRIAGRGNPGLGGGQPGDLLLKVHVTPDELFSRDGDHLTLTMPVSMSELVLGATVSVPTLDGSVRVKIAPGTADGKTLRVRGRGLSARGSDKRGDLLVTLKATWPEELPDDQQQALNVFATLQQQSGYCPRDTWVGAQPMAA